MNVLFWARTDFVRSNVSEALLAIPKVILRVCVDLADVHAEMAGADMLVLSNCPVSEATSILATANASPRLRGVHFITAGRDGFTAAGTFRPDIVVTGPEGAIAQPVAEHAIALALALNRQFLPAYRAQQDSRWDRSMAPKAVSLEGKTALVVGAGPIGREVAVRARAFGMRCVCVTRTPRPQTEFESVHGLDELGAMLPEADLIALCIALAPETQNIIGAREFALCRRTAILVNVGRGGLVDPTALEEALRSSQIAGAGLDVTDPEPLSDGHSLWSAPNLLITPHYSGAGSALADNRIAEGVIRAVQAADRNPDLGLSRL